MPRQTWLLSPSSPPQVSGGCTSANPTGPQAGSQLLAGEEGFSLPADRIYTERTVQTQLRGAQLVGLDVGVHQISQGLGEQWISIKRLRSSDVLSSTLLSQHLRVFNIQFVERLNVVTGKCYWNQEDVLPPPLTKPFDSLICLRAQPGYWTNLGLPNQSVGVGVTQVGPSDR